MIDVLHKLKDRYIQERESLASELAKKKLSDKQRLMMFWQKEGAIEAVDEASKLIDMAIKETWDSLGKTNDFTNAKVEGGDAE